MAGKLAGDDYRFPRLRNFMDRVRSEATVPRLVAGGAVAAGATAYAVLRNPDRRDRIVQAFHSSVEKGRSFLEDRQTSKSEPPLFVS